MLVLAIIMNLGLRCSFLFLLFILGDCCCNDTLPMNIGEVFPMGLLDKADSDAVAGLLEEILADYDVRIRPRQNQSHVIDVNVTFAANSIVALDTTEQRLDVQGFFTVVWHDELLHWEPMAFNDLNILKLPLAQVWRPKLVIVKAVGGSNIIGNEKLDIVHIVSSSVENYATVGWVPESIYSVLCDLNVAFYPFDVQECQLQFYVSDELIESVYLTPVDEVNLDQYSENAEWKLLSVKTKTDLQYGTNIVSITFKLERRAEFTLLTIVMPLLMLSILDVCGILVPVDCGEKISFMVTLFLTFCFFVFTMRDGLPHNSLHLSYFLIYLLQLSIISVVSVIYTILQTRIFQSFGHTTFNRSVVCRRITQWCRPNNRSVHGYKAKTTSTAPATTLAVKQATKIKPGAANKPHKESQDKGIADNQHGNMTWEEAFSQLDKYTFSLLSVCLAIFTISFFGAVLNR